MRVIGTAGHVDHGKSTLVHALTGIDPDRLREEKEREMTIDLGFAWLTLPDGEQVGIIDVPGHIDFIKNMLAGVGGIDAALFVVAADEGVMPQTREHLAILDLLQVRNGVVALTKVDAVGEEGWLELVEADLEQTLSGTCLAEAPIVRVFGAHRLRARYAAQDAGRHTGHCAAAPGQGPATPTHRSRLQRCRLRHGSDRHTQRRRVSGGRRSGDRAGETDGSHPRAANPQESRRSGPARQPVGDQLVGCASRPA